MDSTVEIRNVPSKDGWIESSNPLLASSLFNVRANPERHEGGIWMNDASIVAQESADVVERSPIERGFVLWSRSPK